MPGELVESLRQARNAMAEAHQSAARVRGLVRDMMSYTRDSSEPPRAVDVHQVLEFAVGLTAAEIRPKARMVKAYGRVPSVHGHDSRLGQVFLNLLLHAAQGIPEGQADFHEVRITTRPAAQGWVAVEVSDTGNGVAPERMSRVYDPLNATEDGSGPALALCHELVTAMGGEMEVRSQPGRGTVIQVLLPAAVEEPARSTARQPARTPRGRVLVIDGDPVLCTTLTRLLTPQHDVVTTSSAAEALQRLEAGEPFDIIFCDVALPRVSGTDLHKTLERRRPELAERIVFLTGGTFSPQARAYLESVPNRRVEKPFNAEALIAVTRELIAR